MPVAPTWALFFAMGAQCERNVSAMGAQWERNVSAMGAQWERNVSAMDSMSMIFGHCEVIVFALPNNEKM